MKRLLLLLITGLLVPLAARAALVLDETFSYADGPLVTVSAGAWATHSGTAGQVDVSLGKVNLTQAESEDVNRLLNGFPYTSGNLYASFLVNFSTLPIGTGGYFAHFKDDGTTLLKCRIFATTSGADAGAFRVGIANGGNTPVVIGRDLSLGTDYLLVVRYDTATAASTLWISPSSEDSLSDRADGTDSTSTTGIHSFALRQSTATGNGMGVLTLDDLKVGTTFADVTGGGNPNDNPPILSSIAGQSIPSNTSTIAIPFTVSDGETPAEDLTLSAVSLNQTLVSDAGIAFGGSGSNRTVTITPLGFQQGFATITVTVKDLDDNVASRNFTVVVGAPSISAIENQTTPIGTATPPLAFTVSDPESDPLGFSVVSTNETVVPAANVTFDGSGTARTVTVTPAAGVSGVTRISIFVSDGFNTASNSFVVTVFPTRGVDFADSFFYDDGSVITNSFFTWNTHSAGVGQTGQTQVAQARLFLSSTNSEDIHAFLTNAPYAPAQGWMLYARFTVNFSARPSSSAGDYFAHFRNTGISFGARVFAANGGAAAGRFRLGIANNSGSPSAVLPVDLETNVTYTVVTRYNVATGQSTLWVNPAAETDAGATATDTAFPFEVWNYAFRQSGGIGSMAVDDLVIGTSFSDVASGLPPRLNIAQAGGAVQISWTTNSVGFALQSNLDVGNPNGWQSVAEQPAVVGDKYLLVVPNPTGNLFYRLRQ